MTRAAFIAAQRTEQGIPYATGCRALGVSQSWFHKWRHGDVSPRRARRKALDAMVLFLFRQRRGLDGSPRIHEALRRLGWKVSVNTVAASMREQGLRARPRRRRQGLTKAGKQAKKAPDALRRDFTPPEEPNRRWVGDLTEIPSDGGKLYLADVLDLHSRRCVGFAMSTHHDSEVAVAALQVAIATRGGTVAGVVFHTDQGGEYTGRGVKDLCGRAGIVQSMGRTGSALDNAVAESFHSTLEFELLSQFHFTTRAQARAAVAQWIDEYNHERLHSTADMMPPVEYELSRRAA